jgi:hypothetical protein
MNQNAPITATGFGPDLGPFDWADPLRLEDQLTEMNACCVTPRASLRRTNCSRA